MKSIGVAVLILGLTICIESVTVNISPCPDGQTKVGIDVNGCSSLICHVEYRCVPKSEHICSEYKPCLHKGICRVVDGDYHCKCKGGFYGKSCEVLII